MLCCNLWQTPCISGSVCVLALEQLANKLVVYMRSKHSHLYALSGPSDRAEDQEEMMAATGGGAGALGPAPASRIYPSEVPGMGRRRKPKRGQEVREGRGGHLLSLAARLRGRCSEFVHYCNP